MTVIETCHGPVEYIEAGSGTPILYFHGTGITCDGMLPFEEPLVESGLRVIMFNRPGYGATPLADNTSAKACSTVACALMDALNLGSACVMGSSGGAAFATSFAVNHPDRTDSLVLMCPNLHRWSDKPWLPAHSQNRGTLPCLRNRWLRKLFLKLYSIQLRRFSVDQYLMMQAGSRYESVRNDPAVLKFCERCLEAMADGPAHSGFENDMIVFVTEDVIDDHTPIAPPVLIVHDREDPMAPVAHVDWFASFNPECDCVSLHTAGHLIWTGPDAKRMHDSRVRFITEHAKNAP